MGLMRRQSLVKFDAPLCETIVETPKPLAKEVLVRIERCGLCHSDLHIQSRTVTPTSAAARSSTPRVA